MTANGRRDLIQRLKG